MATIEQVLDPNNTTQAQVPGTAPTSGVSQTAAGGSSDLLSYQFPDSTNLVVERYHKYIKLIHSIENFAEGYRQIAASTVKQYESLNKSVTTGMPNFEVSGDEEGATKVSGSAKLGNSAQPEGVDGASITSADAGSPADLNTFLAVMRKKLGDGYTRSMDFQTKVQTQILPDLKHLEAEIDKKQKEYASFSHAEEKDLSQLRSGSAKLTQTLDSAVQEFERGVHAKNRSDYKKDPYLVKKNLLRDAALQVKAENNRIEFLASSETALRAAEARILLELRRLFDLLTQFIDYSYGGTVQSFDTLRDVLNRVPEDLEWSNFVSRNRQYLITANAVDDTVSNPMSNLSLSSAPASARSNYAQAAVSDNSFKRNLEDVTFRNNAHPSTRPVLEGVLARKETTLGLAGKYNSYYFVISPAGYFYGFPSRSVDSFQPNLVLYIPDCETKIRNSSSGQFSFSLRGKDLSNVVPMPKKKYVFKASSAEDFDTWWKVISNYSGEVQSPSALSSDGSDLE